MAAEQSFREELDRVLAGRPEREQKHLFLGILSRWMPAKSRPVLVGGSLVEYYSMGAIASLDIDLVGDRATVARFLEAAGFAKHNRHWVHPRWPLVVEVPGSELRPTESVQELRVDGYTFLAVSAEDAIVDRLLAAKFWSSQTDWERAIVLATTLKPELDWGPLLQRAKANDVADIAQELRDLLR